MTHRGAERGGYACRMAEEKIRLGGMALSNGVLVHGPTAWACAIRTDKGALKVASARKRFPASRVRSPFLRGPARLAEVFTLLPAVRRRLPEARLPFERPGVLAATLASAVVVRTIRDSTPIGPVAQEPLAGLLGPAPATSPHPSSSRSPRPRSPRAWSSKMATREHTRRLPPEVFELPVEKMREGYYTDAYFNHTRDVLLADGRHPRVVMQVFQRKLSVLGG